MKPIRVFLTGGGSAGLELWVSDGTAAGTTQVWTLGGSGGGAAPRLLTGAASRLYFLATLADGSEQLWTSDGTPGGTRPLTTFPHSALAATHWIATAGDRAYLVADDVVAGGAGTEIWASEGTPAGTRRGDRPRLLRPLRRGDEPGPPAGARGTADFPGERRPARPGALGDRRHAGIDGPPGPRAPGRRLPPGPGRLAGGLLRRERGRRRDLVDRWHSRRHPTTGALPKSSGRATAIPPIPRGPAGSPTWRRRAPRPPRTSSPPSPAGSSSPAF